MNYQNQRKFKKRKRREKHIQKMANMRRNRPMTEARKDAHKQRMTGQRRGLGKFLVGLSRAWAWLTRQSTPSTGKKQSDNATQTAPQRKLTKKKY